jgi:predicted transglutaminase-like cysteine proteinase
MTHCQPANTAATAPGRRFAHATERRRRRSPSRTMLALCGLLGMLTAALAEREFLSEELLADVEERYGGRAERSLLRWQKFILKNRDQDEEKKLDLVNRYFNAIPYAEDARTWNREDYWATPVELLARDRGDCEDYAIAKYFTLREMGVDADKMRILYVEVVGERTRSRVGQGLNARLSHMVLGYYETPTSRPLILDNLARRIEPASERTDLRPIYSYNTDKLLQAIARGRGIDIGRWSPDDRWYALMLRI